MRALRALRRSLSRRCCAPAWPDDPVADSDARPRQGGAGPRVPDALLSRGPRGIRRAARWPGICRGARTEARRSPTTRRPSACRRRTPSRSTCSAWSSRTPPCSGSARPKPSTASRRCRRCGDSVSSRCWSATSIPMQIAAALPQDASRAGADRASHRSQAHDRARASSQPVSAAGQAREPDVDALRAARHPRGDQDGALAAVADGRDLPAEARCGRRAAQHHALPVHGVSGGPAGAGSPPAPDLGVCGVRRRPAPRAAAVCRDSA